MQIAYEDFNNATPLFAGRFAAEWAEVEAVLKAMPLHIKASDQDGKQGEHIFDPVATNATIKAGMQAKGWAANAAIPDGFKFLGIDVDFIKNGLLVESQFSNYPFLLNNLLRTQLFFRDRPKINGWEVDALVIITKAGMFPASNSTLYYEQALEQTRILKSVIDLPVRVVGLKETAGVPITALHSTYGGRYSRAPSAQQTLSVRLTPRRAACGTTSGSYAALRSFG